MTQHRPSRKGGGYTASSSSLQSFEQIQMSFGWINVSFPIWRLLTYCGPFSSSPSPELLKVSLDTRAGARLNHGSEKEDRQGGQRLSLKNAAFMNLTMPCLFAFWDDQLVVGWGDLPLQKTACAGKSARESHEAGKTRGQGIGSLQRFISSSYIEEAAGEDGCLLDLHEGFQGPLILWFFLNFWV